MAVTKTPTFDQLRGEIAEDIETFAKVLSRYARGDKNRQRKIIDDAARLYREVLNIHRMQRDLSEMEISQMTFLVSKTLAGLKKIENQ
ncbi:MAG: hypothetical protein AAB452_00215 [Patescibacteria group bacterium]